jgi:hypothetical protein
MDGEKKKKRKECYLGKSSDILILENKNKNKKKKKKER